MGLTFDISMADVKEVENWSNAKLMILYGIMEDQMVKRGIMTYDDIGLRTVDISKVHVPREGNDTE